MLEPYPEGVTVIAVPDPVPPVVAVNSTAPIVGFE